MRRGTTAALAACAVIGAVALTGAQTKRPAGFADYGQWETLVPGGPRGGLSPDGRFVAYAINRTNRANELRVTTLAGGATKTIAFGTQPAWSADSKYLACAIGVSEDEQERMRREQRQVRNKLGLLELGTGKLETLDAIQSFAFSPDGAYLAIRPYPPERASGAGASQGGVSARGGPGSAAGPAEPDETPGTTLVVRELATGRDTAFGNVSEFAWQASDRGRFLAMTISAAGKTGNGVHLLDPATGVLRVLASAPSVFTGLSWRKDSSDLAVLEARTDDRREGATHVILAWTGLEGKERSHRYDPAADKAFPAGMRTVSYRRLEWSRDGSVLFLGVAKWDEKIAPDRKTTGTASTATDVAPYRNRTSQHQEGQGGRGSGAGAEPQVSTVEVWHAKDVFVMPLQKTRAASDRRRNLLAAWHLHKGVLVQLGKDFVNEQVTPIPGTMLASVAEWSKYAMNRSIGRPGADLYLADVATGTRTAVRENLNDRYVQAGPAGRCLLFVQNGHYWTVNLETRAVTNITRSVPTSFINTESDQTSPEKPPYGVAGWTREDESVLLYDKYDVWRVRSDGTGAERLTSGAAEQVRHRVARLEPDEDSIDLAKPIYLSLFGEWTKKSGYARLDPGSDVKRLVWLDKNVGSLAKAKDADVYAYIVQAYDDSPDLFAGDADLSGAKQTTSTNAFQADFAWGKSELVDYRTGTGRRLQAALIYPAGYEPGRKYPMIVYNYEALSQNVHRYVAPSDREYYNLSVFSSQGYFVLQPDIVFTPRKPGASVIECVTAAVRRVIEMGLVDPKRIGVVGHSMGGYNTSILATRTNGVFAAAVAGAPMTDLVSYYGDHHWSSGIAETDHIETGQERMVVPLYEDLQAYIDASAVFAVHKMTTPLLLEVGDQDGTVAWHQGIELYNIARRAGKNVVMLAYIGEDHGLRQKPNQTDYQKRILAWFGHYLKGDPAEPWITEGQTFLEREAEIRRIRAMGERSQRNR
ncbi:MAG: prolyl oligopeptidase family serine peptidase [Vicinamibacterales bacterium]